MKTKLFTGVALAAMMIPGAAFAQSTGSVDFDQGDIVVTAARPTKGVAGVVIPDSPKAKAVLTQQFIAHQTPGQSVDEIINQLPGVSFQSQDPYGSSGGRLTIRGFGPDRISQTVDGVPLNDTGNYAIYSNQQVDPELIDQVSVNYGSTDVDSPTASASGSTVNYRTLIPTDKFGVRLLGSVGDLHYFRVFGVVNTGAFTSFGTKAWVSMAHAVNDNVYTNFGEYDKTAYNAKIYQPIGSNGDFFSIAGNYNVNRNQNAPDFPLRSDTTGGRVVGTGTTNRIPLNRGEAFINSPVCQTAVGISGVADTTNACGTSATFEQNINPSNTGSIRGNSRFTLAPGLVLTVDPSFQYTKANGGAYGVGAFEYASPAFNSGTVHVPAGLYGFLNNSYYVGRDLNGDGDMLDKVEMDATSQTVTHRYIVTSSLRWDISSDQTVRVSYTHDYGRHRQTGEMAGLRQNGQPIDPFPINIPTIAPTGFKIEKRDRKSFAILDQISGEYRGQFMDDKLVVNAGVRAPFFKRDLQQNCFTTSAGGFLDCVAGDATTTAAYAAANPYGYVAPGGSTVLPIAETIGGVNYAAGATYTNNTTAPVVFGFAPPQHRVYKFHAVLPNVGLTFRMDNGLQFYANYSRGLQVPGTDNLYQAFFYPQGVQSPKPETTDNFDIGIRYTSSKIQAQFGPWYTIFTNRLASSYDPILDQTTYRNLGRVDKYGLDGSISYQPIRELSLYAFGSYLKSKIKDNILAGACSAAQVTAGAYGCTTAGADFFYPTAGKREAGAPTYTLGARAQVNVNPVQIGIQAKRTGPRYVNDANTPIYSSNTLATQIYGAKAPAYTVVDLDARVSMAWAGLNDTTYVQLNVTNLFNEFYLGNLNNANTSNTSIPFVYLGPPRTVSVSLNVQF